MGQEVTRDAVQVVVDYKDGANFLESPDLLVDFAVLNTEELTVDRVINEQSHIFSLALNRARGVELSLDNFDFGLDVMKVVLGEGLVLEE